MVLLTLFLLVVFSLGASSLWAARVSDVEEPVYTVLEVGEAYEVRYYPARLEARTRLQSPERQDMSGGFRRLANYIFGGNRQGHKIAMTAPVGRFETPAGWQMSFAIPAEYRAQDLPAPLDPAVSLVSVPAGSFAVVTFSGRASLKKANRYQNRLYEALISDGKEPVGAPVLAQYDPPMQLPSLRRNEILIPIASPL
jgi:hypothetical protein